MMEMVSYSCSIVVIMLVYGTSGQDYFSATSEMAKLFTFEKDFIEHLYKLDTVLDQQPSQSNTGDLLTQLIDHSSHFPANMDQMDGVLSGLFLLQDSFNLNITEFAGGSVTIEKLSPDSFSSHAHLQYEDIDYLAKTAYNKDYYHRAVEWFKEAVKSAINTKSDKVVSTAKNLLQTTISVHDKILDKKGHEGSINGKPWKTNMVPFDEKLKKKKKYKKSLKEHQQREENYKIQYVRNFHNPVLNDQFSRLCRGEQLLDANVTKDVFCSFLHHQDPYLRLGPFKIDDQSMSPYITVFRDFFSETEMNHYKDYARNKLERSGYGNSNHISTDASTTGLKRTSKQTWLSEVDEMELLALADNDNFTKVSIGPYLTNDAFDIIEEHQDKFANGVSERLMKATSMYVRVRGGGEPYQIANYGLGGYYNHHPDPHMWHHPNVQDKKHDDWVKAEYTMMGDRLATFMGYLSDAQLGGATAFPNVGIAVKV